MKDRYIGKRCLEKIFTKGSDLKINPTEVTNYVDLKCSIRNTNDIVIPFNVEIKERYKNEINLKKYPNAELKVEKLNNMMKETPAGTKILYMVLLNSERCLLFELDKIDWDKIQKSDWVIKKTQFNEKSQSVSTPTYNIPYDLAKVDIDCRDIYEEYNRLKGNS